jgi:hypothetical protein
MGDVEKIGGLKIFLLLGFAKRLSWFWRYVVLRKPMALEIGFEYRCDLVYDEDWEPYYVDPVPQFLSLVDRVKVAELKLDKALLDRYVREL